MDRNTSKTFVFIFHHSIQHEASGCTFYNENKAFAREYFWFIPYKKLDLLTAELFFKLPIPQRYVHNLERYWKNFVCISVKNFANL